MLNDLPRSPGVYSIECMSTEKVYVGSSVDMRKRIGAHIQLLNRGTHHNMHLQRAWLRYGADDFMCAVLEPEIDGSIREQEQYWIDVLEPEFNLVLEVETPFEADGNERAARPFKIRAPDGTIIEGTNLKKFCREHDLGYVNVSSMLALYPGACKQMKGYSPVDGEPSKTPRPDFFMQSPDGEVVHVTNIDQFCQKYGLKHPSVNALRKGEYSQTKGWTLYDGDNDGSAES